MTRWKITNKEEALKNGVGKFELPEGLVSLELKYLPNGMTIIEWINFLVENGILLMEN